MKYEILNSKSIIKCNEHEADMHNEETLKLFHDMGIDVIRCRITNNKNDDVFTDVGTIEEVCCRDLVITFDGADVVRSDTGNVGIVSYHHTRETYIEFIEY